MISLLITLKLPQACCTISSSSSSSLHPMLTFHLYIPSFHPIIASYLYILSKHTILTLLRSKDSNLSSLPLTIKLGKIMTVIVLYFRSCPSVLLHLIQMKASGLLFLCLRKHRAKKSNFRGLPCFNSRWMQVRALKVGSPHLKS